MAKAVALISHEYPPYIFGGVGTFCHDLSQKLAENQIHTKVITGRSAKLKKTKINKYLTVIRLPLLNYPPRHLWFQIQNFDTFSNLFNNTSLIHCIRPELSVISSHYKKKYSIPMITSLHGTFVGDLKIFLTSPISTWTLGDFGYNFLEYPLNEVLYRQALNNSDKILTCSNSTLSEIKKIYPGEKSANIEVIHNAVKIEDFDKINASDIGNDSCYQYVVFYGRLYWRKGLTFLIYAIKKLIKTNPGIKLDIFGKGPMRNYLLKIIAQNNLENNVKINGHVAYDTLLTSIKRANLIILPSLYEAQSIAMLEAMAFKKTVVAFDLPFAREIIKNNYTGILAKPSNEYDLSKKIQELLTNPDKRKTIGNNAYNHVKKNHNWNIIIKKFIDVYNQLT
jgi:glycosyltransferase involved in cell wall biosynthesis